MIVTLDGQLVSLGRRRERLLLAVLLLDVGRPVELGRLIELLWDPDEQPRDPRATVHVYVSRLRQALDGISAADRGVRLGSDGSAYVLHADPQSVDVHRFARLVREAGALEDPAACGEMLRTALSLWRGEALSGLTDAAVRDRICSGLAELRLAAMELRIEADLRLGRHAALVPEVTELIAAHPTRERLVGQLMVALYRSGRQGDALSAYQAATGRLADDLGMDPGEELRHLHLAILRDDPGLALGGRWEPAARPAPSAPAQLPAVGHTFVGRDSELAELLAVADAADAAARGALIVISGMAGVGKTTLAVRAARALAEGYPDGQLFLDLHGFSAVSDPADPGEALDRMLRALGVPARDIPAALDDRSAVFRAELADRRVLVVLDNAATETQLRPLLAGVAGCLTLVTSRISMAGLDDAIPVRLEVLRPPAARLLLGQLTGTADGADGTAGVPGEAGDALSEVADLCGRLPLALRIVAARMRHRPSWSLPYMAGRLREENGRLTELHAGERSVAAALELSSRDLPAPERACFERLGLAPLGTFGDRAAAALVGVELVPAGYLLERLVDAHLLEAPAPGRYHFHALVRLYAAAALAGNVPAAERQACLLRLFAHYLSGVAAALTAIAPHIDPAPQAQAGAGQPFPAFATPAQALAWLEAERDNMVSLAVSAMDAACYEPARLLATGLFYYLELGSHEAAGIRLFEHVRQGARAAGDRMGEAGVLRGLAVFHARHARDDLSLDLLGAALDLHRGSGPSRAMAGVHATMGEHYLRRGSLGESHAHLAQAMAIYRDTGDRMGQAHCLSILGPVLWSRGQGGEAIAAARRARELCGAAGNRNGEAYAALLVGIFERMSGEYGEGLGDLRYACAIFEASGDRTGQSHARSEIGAARAALGELDEAWRELAVAVTLARQTENANAELEAHHQWGEALRTAGRLDEAIGHQRQAVALAARLQQPRDYLRAHDGLAQTLAALGRAEEAIAYWAHCLERFGTVGLPEAAQARAHLAAARRLDAPARA
jgi:DNA-binding SARP family transcriptional activator/tetratricopeptide (TPR) repeat protein